MRISLTSERPHRKPADIELVVQVQVEAVSERGEEDSVEKRETRQRLRQRFISRECILRRTGVSIGQSQFRRANRMNLREWERIDDHVASHDIEIAGG